jgi:hypothetical protein
MVMPSAFTLPHHGASKKSIEARKWRDYFYRWRNVEEVEMGTNFFTKGTYEPEELGALKQVFEELAAEPWFDNTPENREGFAKYLFETFPAVHFDPKRHRSIIEASARMFYSRNGI